MRTRLPTLFALCLELSSWAAARAAEPLAGAAVFLALHGAASVLAVYSLRQRLPPWARSRDERDRALLFTFAFFLPFVGVLGVLGGVEAALATPKRRNARPTHDAVEEPELPHAPLVGDGRAPLPSSLTEALRFGQDVRRRLQLLRATARVSDRHAVPLLEVALKDPSDEVRLLAYALLDAKERSLYGQIRQDTERLHQAPGPERPKLHARLAEAHWELVYRKLVKGDAARQALETARAHADSAEAERTLSLSILQGRLLLALGRHADAEAALERARADGAAPDAVLPYLAELALLRGSCSKAQASVSEIASARDGRGGTEQVRGLWS